MLYLDKFKSEVVIFAFEKKGGNGRESTKILAELKLENHANYLRSEIANYFSIFTQLS